MIDTETLRGNILNAIYASLWFYMHCMYYVHCQSHSNTFLHYPLHNNPFINLGTPPNRLFNTQIHCGTTENKWMRRGSRGLRDVTNSFTFASIMLWHPYTCSIGRQYSNIKNWIWMILETIGDGRKHYCSYDMYFKPLTENQTASYSCT